MAPARSIRRASKLSGRWPGKPARFLPFCWICKVRKSAWGISNRAAELWTGAEFVITVEPVTGNCERASTSYAKFARDVRPGDRVLLADGAVELRMLATDGVSARMCAVSGGPISDHQGINLPGANLSIPSLTEKDLADLQF
jgi:pyruvate kinase